LAEEALGAAATDRIAGGRTVIRPIRQGMLNEEEALRMILRGGAGSSKGKTGSSLASSPVTTRDGTLQLSRRKLSTSAGAESTAATSKGRPTPTSSTPTAAAVTKTDTHQFHPDRRRRDDDRSQPAAFFDDVLVVVRGLGQGSAIAAFGGSRD